MGAAKHMRLDQEQESLGLPRQMGLLLALALVCTALSAAGCFLASALGGWSHGWFNRFWFAFFWICTFVLGAVFINRRKLGSKPELIYLIIGLGTVLLFAITISVRTVGWDIGTHYKNTLTFSDWEGEVEKSESDETFIRHNEVADRSQGLFRYLGMQEDILDEYASVYYESFERPQSILWYVTGVEYVLYSLVMKLCRLVGLSFSHTILLMRMAGGTFYVLITYLGMKKLKFGKMLYAAICLLPSSMFLAVELGYSYWLFSLCLYGLASLVGMIQGNVKVGAGTLIKMLLALFVGMLPRVVYFPLIFLCLFIPNKRFPSVRFARVYRGVIIGCAVATLCIWLVPRLLSGFGTGDARGGEVNPAGQISYILSHPVEYAQLLLRFMLPPLKMEGGGADVEGVNLISGYLSPEASPGLLVNYGYMARPHWIYTAAIWVMLGWTALTDHDRKHRYSMLTALAALVLTFGIFVLITTSLYFDFTPVGLNEIHGVQRRYIIPLIYPFLAFVVPNVLGLTGEDTKVNMRVYNGFVLLGMFAILLCSWFTTCVVAIV
ncbi:MAG: DUF2142 domain-containing protein [Coriobacteriales bacterium]|nr:DUF2142 domain-containing protein [Coriobacteriales bacterium]